MNPDSRGTVDYIEVVLITGGVLALLSIFASKASGRLGVPALLLFLAIGMLAGSEGPGGIDFDDAALAQTIGVVALVLILFSGGLDTSAFAIRAVLGRALALSTVGVLLTAALVGGFAALVLDMSWQEGLLLGAIVSSTDAAAVFAVLRSRDVRLRSDVRDLLEVESGSNDPMAVFLTLSLVALIQEPGTHLAGLALAFVLQMGLGLALGYVTGRVATLVINRARLDYDGLYPVLSLALMALVFGLTSYAGGNGFLAVYVAGITMGNSVFIHKRSLMLFHDGLAWLGQIAMFLTLGLLVFPSHVVPVIGVGLLAALFLMFVARPLSVMLVLAFSRFQLRARVLVGWVGLRGAVPIILATFPLVSGVPGAETIFNVVFFIVLTSALVQGTTIPLVARWLRVEGAAFRRDPVSSADPVDRQLVEYQVLRGSSMIGQQVARTALPDGAHVLLVQRGTSFIVPRGTTRVREEDILVVLAEDEALQALDGRAGLRRLGRRPAVCDLGAGGETQSLRDE